MIRYLAPIVFFAVMVPVFIFGLHRDPTVLPSPLIDRQAPAFRLPSLEHPGQIVSSDDYAGQLALVNVWATWCSGCRQEHGFLLDLARRNEIPIIGLNWRDERAAAMSWLDTLGDPYTATGFDGDGRVGIDWGVYGAPETFLVGADGIVLHKHIAPLTEQVWQDEFLPIINAARESRP